MIFRRVFLSGLAATFAMLLCWSVASALQFDAWKKVDDAWKKQNMHDGRYEGIRGHDTADNSYGILDMLALTDASLDDTTPRDLHILFYMPESKTLPEPHVGSRLYGMDYMMIPLLQPKSGEWNRFDKWPTRDVIVPKSVPVTTLAPLFLLKDTEQRTNLAPVILFGETAPTTLRGYALDIRLGKPMRMLRCTLQDASGKIIRSRSAAPVCTHDGGTGIISASVLRFSISSSALPDRPGPITIVLDGSYANDANSAPFHSELHFYHQPHLPRWRS